MSRTRTVLKINGPRGMGLHHVMFSADTKGFRGQIKELLRDVNSEFHADGNALFIVDQGEMNTGNGFGWIDRKTAALLAPIIDGSDPFFGEEHGRFYVVLDHADTSHRREGYPISVALETDRNLDWVKAAVERLIAIGLDAVLV